jgi:hypothetical protein
MDWLTLSFWTLDVFASLRTGFVRKGELVMDPAAVAKNYFKTWFAIDMLIIVPEWTFILLDLFDLVTSQTGSLVGLLWIMRAFRVGRLVRLMKLRQVMSYIAERLNSEYTFVLSEILKLVLGILCINHFIGCIWYALGNAGRKNGELNWLEYYEVEQETLVFRYATSLHWSLGQFTPAPMNIQPQRLSERIFAICVLVFGMICFSSFVSGLTASVTVLRQMSSNNLKDFWLLRRYLDQWEVTPQLTFRILKYAEHAVNKQTDHMPEAKVTLLNLLSGQLKDELRVATTYASMAHHNLFKKVIRSSGLMVHRLCTVLALRAFAQDDTIFNPGSKAKEMYFINRGEVRYQLAKSYRNAKEDKEDKYAGPPSWMCEAVLWTAEWHHLGKASAHQECALVVVNGDGFGEVLRWDALVHTFACLYAESFVSWLNSCKAVNALEEVCADEALQQTINEFVADSWDVAEGLAEDHGSTHDSSRPTSPGHGDVGAGMT